MSETEEIVDIHIFHRHVPNWIVSAVFFITVIIVSSGLTLYRRSIDSDFLRLNGSEKALELTYGNWPSLGEIEFFSQTKEDFVRAKYDFIEVDLSQKILRLYKSGKVVREIPVLSQGREGSWWETPAGLYKIGRKEKRHFSTLGNVYMPWSLPFQGNFFIHGWPVYEDGSPVPPGYSGGCIRLSTDDAQWLYDNASFNMPILVFKKDFESDSFSYEMRVPSLQAESYLAADLKSGFVLTDKESSKVLPIASLTKLMTALVAIEHINIEKEITITEDMIIPTSRPRLKAGEILRVFDLLNILLLESSNEAAEALARGYYGGRNAFIKAMNEKTKAIGMRDTVFVDSSGISSGNKSSSRDLFILARHLYNNRKFVLSLSRGLIDNKAYGAPVFNNLENYNVFDKMPEFVGGKVGLTAAAGGTLLSVFELSLNGQKRPIMIALLNASDYEKEAKELFRWIRGNY